MCLCTEGIAGLTKTHVVVVGVCAGMHQVAPYANVSSKTMEMTWKSHVSRQSKAQWSRALHVFAFVLLFASRARSLPRTYVTSRRARSLLPCIHAMFTPLCMDVQQDLRNTMHKEVFGLVTLHRLASHH